MKQKSVYMSFTSHNIGAEEYNFDNEIKFNSVRLVKLLIQHSQFLCWSLVCLTGTLLQLNCHLLDGDTQAGLNGLFSHTKEMVIRSSHFIKILKLQQKKVIN